MQLSTALSGLLVALVATASNAAASTIYVPDDFPLIQNAINAATDGDEVVLRPGTYAERGIYLTDQSIHVRSENPDDPAVVAATIVDGWNYGQRDDGVFVARSGSDTTTVLEGLTITRGQAEYGGALYMRSSGLTVRNCVITYCNAVAGGAIAVEDYTSLIVTGCTMQYNFAEYAGAINIEAEEGFGGIYRIEFTRLVNNSAEFQVGAMQSSDTVLIRNSIVDGNGAEWSAGVVFTDHQGSRIQNCVIANNFSSEVGGALYLDGTTTGAEVRNSIIWGNYPVQITTESQGLVVEYSDVEGGWWGTGNLNANPLFFAKPYYGFDYLLGPQSPCIDAGDPLVEDGIYDSHPRWPRNYPNGSRSDIGAYGGPANIGWLRN